MIRARSQDEVIGVLALVAFNDTQEIWLQSSLSQMVKTGNGYQDKEIHLLFTFYPPAIWE